MAISSSNLSSLAKSVDMQTCWSSRGLFSCFASAAPLPAPGLIPASGTLNFGHRKSLRGAATREVVWPACWCSSRPRWHRGRAASTLRPTCFGLATSLFSSPGDSMATAAVAQQVAAAAGAHSSMEDTLDEAASNGDCQTEGNDEHMALPPARGVAVLKQGWLHKLSYRYKFRSGDCSSIPSDPRTHLLYHAARMLASAFSHALPLTLGSLFLPGGKGGRSATWR